MENKEFERELCAFCGTEIDWEGADEWRGTIWSCEKCGLCFCEACLQEKHGLETLCTMLFSDDPFLCPDCYEKET
jgi:hypothetical protein